MNDSQCVDFLQWALPRLRMRWPGFRKVRRQVCKGAQRRAAELGLPNLLAYRGFLEAHPDEFALLDQLTCITISRFYRDRGTYELLARDVLPGLAVLAGEHGSGALEVWSAGCASGEEPYTLAIIWELEVTKRFPTHSMRILATDVHAAILERAREARFSASSLRELPERWRVTAFENDDGVYRLRDRFKQLVTVAAHDIRAGAPDGPFDLVMCRNLAFTYFDMDLQREIGASLARSLRPGGALVLGAHEQLPAAVEGFTPWNADRRVYRRGSVEVRRP